jgi:hypothetical protein
MPQEEIDELLARISQINALRWQALLTCPDTQAGKAIALQLSCYGEAVQELVRIAQLAIRDQTAEAYRILQAQEDELLDVMNLNRTSS